MRRFALLTLGIVSVGFFSMSLVFFSQTALAEPNSSSDPALAPERLAHISENCTHATSARRFSYSNLPWFFL